MQNPALPITDLDPGAERPIQIDDDIGSNRIGWSRHLMPWRTDLAWRWWGDTDPFYGVLTADQYRAAATGPAREKFYDTGAAHARHMLERIGPVPASARALDYGAGVGRVTTALAPSFAEVVGVDCSPGMLREAARRCEERKLDNVRLLRPEQDWQAGGFHFVHCYLVLQHLRRREGIKTIRNLLQAVQPGGWVALQVSLRRRLGLVDECRYHLETTVPLGALLLNTVRGRSLKAPMLATAYDLSAVLDMFDQHGFGKVLVCRQDRGPIATSILIAQRD